MKPCTTDGQTTVILKRPEAPAIGEKRSLYLSLRNSRLVQENTMMCLGAEYLLLMGKLLPLPQTPDLINELKFSEVCAVFFCVTQGSA